MEVPATLEDFRIWAYPDSAATLPETKRTVHSSVTLLWRVREMQQALWSYEQDLDGSERKVDLKELRQYVAYPTNEQLSLLGDKCPRRYLAVCDVHIDCSFPYAQVEHLGIIDLPGLGELASHAEEHHLAGLRDEVDLVLLIKRPVEGLAYWGKEDGKTAEILDEARGFIKNRRDFVLLVVNAGDSDQKLAESLLDNIKREVNEGQDDKHFHVLTANASNRESVNNNILGPVLEHLAERLPVMDDEVLGGARARYLTLMSRIALTLNDIENVLQGVVHVDASPVEELDRRTEELRKNIAASLSDLVKKLRDQANLGDEDPEYLTAIDLAYKQTREWISSGFGKGQAAWCSDAVRTNRVHAGSSTFATGELNRIRVEISKRYSSIDKHFQHKVHDLWSEVATILRKDLKELVSAGDSEEALKKLCKSMDDAEPCPTLSEAIKDLLALRIEYRTHLHPSVRKELDLLSLQQRVPGSDKFVDQIVVGSSDADAEELYRYISQLAEQAAYRTKKALITKADTLSLVLYTAAEQFDDTLIRSGESLRDFKRLTRSYREEIWPGEFKGIDESNARFAKIKKIILSIREHLACIEQGNGK